MMLLSSVVVCRYDNKETGEVSTHDFMQKLDKDSLNISLVNHLGNLFQMARLIPKSIATVISSKFQLTSDA